MLLTARDAVTDRVAGLDSEADDYLGMPSDLDWGGGGWRWISPRPSCCIRPLA